MARKNFWGISNFRRFFVIISYRGIKPVAETLRALPQARPALAEALRSYAGCFHRPGGMRDYLEV